MARLPIIGWRGSFNQLGDAKSMGYYCYRVALIVDRCLRFLPFGSMGPVIVVG